VEWRHDCLVCFFGKTKGDQSGEKAEEPWHVYSNPKDPVTCPVLALAKYLFAHPDLMKANGLLFPGADQYGRFIKIFHRVISQAEDKFLSLGVKKHMLGSHSIRKGAITLVSTGCTVSPPLSSICLRAGWSLGTVKDRYIHYEKAGDQFTGRSVTGISSLDKEFAISPVYWDWTDCDEQSGSEKVDEILSETCVNKREVKPQTFALFRYLFASLCYHSRHLEEVLHETNPLRGSPVFAAISKFEHADKAAVSYPWKATAFSPKPTGIPPHVMILVRMEELKMELAQQSERIMERLKSELDERSVGGSEYRATRIMEDVKELLQNMCLAQRAASTEIDDGSPNIDIGDWDIGDGVSDGDVGEVLNDESPKREPNNRLMISIANGKLCLLPREYKFPKMSFPNFVVMWYCGDSTNKVAPFRLLKAVDLKEIKGGKETVSMMRKLIGHVERAARMTNRAGDLLVRNWTPKRAMTLYNATKHFFRFPLASRMQRRYDLLSWKTFYNMLVKQKGRLLGEISEEMVTTTLTVTATVTATTRGKRRRRGTAVSRQAKRPRRDQERDEVDEAFAAAFADVTPAETEATSGGCSLGDECKHKAIEGYQRCKRCGAKIHHLCAIDKNWLDPDNELNVFCSAICHSLANLATV
ncbi:MAG: hypothetical protein AAF438_18745, partial [Pseudomonadota bacterium]